MKQQKQYVYFQQSGSTIKKLINNKNKLQQTQSIQESQQIMTSKNFKVENFDQNEKENIYHHSQHQETKQLSNQRQKLKKPLTIEIELNSKQRSYSALPALKRWSPIEKVNDDNKSLLQINNQIQQNQNIDKENEQYFVYFIIDKKMNSFNPTIIPFTQDSLNQLFLQMNYLLKLNRTNI